MPPKWNPSADDNELLEYQTNSAGLRQVRCKACVFMAVPQMTQWLSLKANTRSLCAHLSNEKHESAKVAFVAQKLATAEYRTQLNKSFNAPEAHSSAPFPSYPSATPRASMFNDSNVDTYTDTDFPEYSCLDHSDISSQYAPMFQSPISAEEERARLMDQFRQLLLNTQSKDGVDHDTGPEVLNDDCDSSDEEDIGENGSYDWDYSGTADEKYWPYDNKVIMLLDVIDNLGRCRFSGAQMNLILLLLTQLGVAGTPSLKHLRKVQSQLDQTCASTPTKFTSQFGNTFYMNDIRETIARDFSNPTVAPLLHLYPEETDGPISETWQAGRWKEFTPSQLTPMFSRGHSRFWIDEVCELGDINRTVVIPRNWVVRNGELHSDASVVEVSAQGWRLTNEMRSIPASEFKYDYGSLIARVGDAAIPWIGSIQPPSMPNKLRELVDDNEDLYVIMVSPWADDVSGNQSKQYNKHMNIYVTNGCLPGRLVQQEYHVHYVSTSPHATSAEQFSALRDQISESERTPYRCYNAATARPCRFILRCPGLPADNPQQAEESCQAGSAANFPCRRCMWGGTNVEKESDHGFHTCHLVGLKRDAQTIRTSINEQLKAAMTGVEERVKVLQRTTGTKDKVAQHWIDQLIKRARDLKKADSKLTEADLEAKLTEWLDAQPGDKINPLFDIAGLDPSQDTPVEILHTILLGVIKYIWHYLNSEWTDAQRALLAIRLQSSDISGLHIPPLKASYMIQYRNNLIGKHFKSLMQLLVFHIHDITTPAQFTLVKAAADLGAQLWVPYIDNMDTYTNNLSCLVGNLLDAFDAVDPVRILVKIKLHLLPHLPDDIRRFGPAIRSSTETYKAYNAVFRHCSVLSNHRAPSRDISAKFCSLERVKHLFSGGYFWSEERKDWVQATLNVQRVVIDHPILQRHLGWVPEQRPAVSSITQLFGSPTSWASLFPTLSCTTSALSGGPEQVFWRQGKHLTLVNGDAAKEGTWAVVRVNNLPVFGRIVRLLRCENTFQHQQIVVVERFICTQMLHRDYQWPVLHRLQQKEGNASLVAVPVQDVCFTFSAQHDCRQSACKPAVIGKQLQERELTDRDASLVVHNDDEFFVMNMAGLHNFVELGRVLRHLNIDLTPVPLESNREEFHNNAAALARHIRGGRRVEAARKRAAKAEGKRRAADAEVARVAGANVEEMVLSDEEDSELEQEGLEGSDFESEERDRAGEHVTTSVPLGRPRKRKRAE